MRGFDTDPDMASLRRQQSDIDTLKKQLADLTTQLTTLKTKTGATVTTSLTTSGVTSHHDLTGLQDGDDHSLLYLNNPRHEGLVTARHVPIPPGGTTHWPFVGGLTFEQLVTDGYADLSVTAAKMTSGAAIALLPPVSDGAGNVVYDYPLFRFLDDSSATPITGQFTSEACDLPFPPFYGGIIGVQGPGLVTPPVGRKIFPRVDGDGVDTWNVGNSQCVFFMGRSGGYSIVGKWPKWRLYETDANITVQVEDFIKVDATSGNITLTLPPIDDAIGLEIMYMKFDASANTVDITPDGTDVVQGVSLISTQYGVKRIIAITENSGAIFTWLVIP